MSAPTYNGQPVPIITVAPDWRSDVEVRESFRTIVKEALDCSEQRMQCLPRPAYGITYQVTAQGRELATLRKQFERAQALPFGVPLWPHKTMLLQAVMPGDTSLSVDTMDGTLFPIFEYVLIWSGFDRWEVLRASVLMTDSVSLTEAATMEWPAGTDAEPVYVVPLAFGNVKRPSADALNDELGRMPIDFEEVFALQAVITPENELPIEITPEITCSTCNDEITFSVPTMPSSVQNVRDSVWTFRGRAVDVLG